MLRVSCRHRSSIRFQRFVPKALGIASRVKVFYPSMILSFKAATEKRP